MEQGSSELSILGLGTWDEEEDTAGAGDNVIELSMMMIISFLI